MRHFQPVSAAWIAILLGLATPIDARAEDPKEAQVSNSKILVVYYSRTGTTRKLAESIATATGADIEALVDTVNRNGFFGFMRSMRDAGGRRSTTLKPMQHDPTQYDLVIIGTPDWGRSVSAPTRAFLVQYRGRLPKVAFFLTDGAGDHKAVFLDMTLLVDAEPVAVLGIPHDDVVRNKYADRVEAFAKSLQGRPAAMMPKFHIKAAAHP